MRNIITFQMCGLLEINPGIQDYLNSEDAIVLLWWTPEDGGDLLQTINHARMAEVDGFSKNMQMQSETLRYLVAFTRVAWVGSLVVACLNSRIRMKNPDYGKFWKQMCWLPLDVIKKTFAATTQ